MDNTKKCINILLSRHHNLLSRFIYYVTGRDYTHASIGIDDDDTYYSFNGKGFRIEQPKLWKHKDNRIIATVYQIEVSQKEYQKIKEFIDDIKKNQKQYKYSFFGIFMCILRIPYRAKKKYFCSQFVADVLENAGVLNDKMPPSLFLPNSFKKIFANNLSWVKNYSFC